MGDEPSGESEEAQRIKARYEHTVALAHKTEEDAIRWESEREAGMNRLRVLADGLEDGTINAADISNDTVPALEERIDNAERLHVEALHKAQACRNEAQALRELYPEELA